MAYGIQRRVADKCLMGFKGMTRMLASPYVTGMAEVGVAGKQPGSCLDVGNDDSDNCAKIVAVPGWPASIQPNLS